MSKPTCHSRLSSTPDLDITNIQIQNLMDIRNTNDRRITNNVNYVRNVLRRFFGSYNKKYSTISDDNHSDQSENLISPILIHSCLEFNKHKKFSGELLFDWFLLHFENRYENLTLIKQVILQCCTCLVGLDILRIENNQDNDLFRVCEKYICFGKKEQRSFFF